MTAIKRCTSPEQAGWLALRIASWPADSSEHLPDMQDCCEQPGPYAQFLAYSDALLDNTASQDMHLGPGFEETERVMYFRKPP